MVFNLYIYSMFYFFSGISAVLTNLTMGLITFKKGRKKPINILYLLFSIFFTLYIVARLFTFSTNSQVAYYFDYFMSDLFKASGFAWFYSLCRGYDKRKVSILYTTGLLIGIGAPINYFFFKNLLGIWLNVHILFGLFIIFYGLFVLAKASIMVPII